MRAQGMAARWIGWIGAVLAAGGCASSGVTTTQRYASEESVVRPGSVLVYDFAVNPADVQVDAIGTASTAEETKLGRAVARSLSQQRVAKLRERGISARRASNGTRVPPDASGSKKPGMAVPAGAPTPEPFAPPRERLR